MIALTPVLFGVLQNQELTSIGSYFKVKSGPLTHPCRFTSRCTTLPFTVTIALSILALKLSDCDLRPTVAPVF